MNLSEIKTFLAIVETGSLVRASDQLNVTQSTVTARLKSLEEELGQTLIHRNKSGATLTAAGTRLLRYANTISDLWQQARQETALPDGFKAVCNIACEAELWPHLAERFFTFLRLHYPQIAISVWIGSQADVASWLTGGKSDIGFTYRSALNAHQSQIELPFDRLILVTTDPTSPVRFDRDYVFVEAGEEFCRDHAAAYADADTARLSFGTADLGLKHILHSGGSAYLPMRLALPEIEAGKLFIKNAPEFTRRVFLTVNKSAQNASGWFDDAVASLSVPSEP